MVAPVDIDQFFQAAHLAISDTGAIVAIDGPTTIVVALGPEGFRDLARRLRRAATALEQGKHRPTIGERTVTVRVLE